MNLPIILLLAGLALTGYLLYRSMREEHQRKERERLYRHQHPTSERDRQEARLMGVAAAPDPLPRHTPTGTAGEALMGEPDPLTYAQPAPKPQRTRKPRTQMRVKPASKRVN